jgi:glutamine synthetase
MFGEFFLAALRRAGVIPDSFLPEYALRQLEATTVPSFGMKGADDAVVTREVARAVAQRLRHRAIFTPVIDPDGIGNGTHIHFSLWDGDGRPAMPDLDQCSALISSEAFESVAI